MTVRPTTLNGLMNKQQNKKRLFCVKPILCVSNNQAFEEFYNYGNVNIQTYSETSKSMCRKDLSSANK